MAFMSRIKDYCRYFTTTYVFSLPKVKENVENTSLDKCLVLKKAFSEKKQQLFGM